ncbi:hypothetical protein HYFRA_00013397 [Hymenoscyphus fraxineus]|uniref:BTB domain-containing protein n=1 Tax=Hymenoscyphus fraxineus TaxID=746836 RepID=A0A9N9PNA1_9HELO|nr:hypothetical protein HYFRA_00013397 [Hymenoscyphus fraxineus]
MTSNTITFDPDGDPVLVFDEETKKMEKRQHLVVAESKEPGSQISNQDSEKVQMFVSLDILTVASPVFGALFNLAHGFKESCILQNGNRTIHLPDDYPGVFELLIYALYLKELVSTFGDTTPFGIGNRQIWTLQIWTLRLYVICF